MPSLDMLLQLTLVAKSPPTPFDSTDKLLLWHIIKQQVDESPTLHYFPLLANLHTHHGLVAVPSQVDQAVFNFGHDLGVDVLVTVVDDAGQSLEGNGDDVEIIALAIVEDGQYRTYHNLSILLPA